LYRIVKISIVLSKSVSCCQNQICLQTLLIVISYGIKRIVRLDVTCQVFASNGQGLIVKRCWDWYTQINISHDFVQWRARHDSQTAGAFPIVCCIFGYL